MSGFHNSLQTLLEQKYKNAIYIHCYAHKQDLVLKQSVSNIKKCKIFFTNLNGFAIFFQKEDLTVKKRVSSIVLTRWNYNSRLLNIVSEYKDEIKELVLSIVKNADKWSSES